MYKRIKYSNKSEVKSGVIEALIEVLDEMSPESTNYPSLNQIALYSSVLFFGYFLFILPTDLTDLTSYNWINQSLIELKVTVKDYLVNLISNSGATSGPGTPPCFSTPKGPGNIPSLLYSSRPSSPQISPISSADTVTLNNYLKDYKNVGVQTYINGTSVSKMVESVTLMSEVLPEDCAKDIQQGVDKLVKTITD